METFRPFLPVGPTFALMASTPASPSLAGSGEDSGHVAWLVTNLSSTADGWLGVGQTSGAAKARAVVPLLGAPADAVSVPRNTTQTFTFPARSFFSGVTPSGQTIIYITPGRGL